MPRKKVQLKEINGRMYATAPEIYATAEDEFEAKRKPRNQAVAHSKGPYKRPDRTQKSQVTGLTRRQDHFAHCIDKGMTYTDAYIEAYDAKDMKRQTIYSRASEIARNPKVKARLLQLDYEREEQRKALSKGLFTTVCEMLLREASRGENPPAVRVKAAELLGKTVGAFQNVNVNVDGGKVKTIADLENELKQIVSGRIQED